MEDGQRIRFVKARGQRIIKGTGMPGAIPAPGIQPQAGRADRHGQRDGMLFIALTQRHDAAEMKVIGDGRAGSQHLRAADHDAVVAFFEYACDNMVAYFVGGFGTVYLWGDNGNGTPQMLVANFFVKADHVFAEFRIVLGEYFRRACKAGEKTAHAIRTASDHAVGKFRKFCDALPAPDEILPGARNLVPESYRLACFG